MENLFQKYPMRKILRLGFDISNDQSKERVDIPIRVCAVLIFDWRADAEPGILTEILFDKSKCIIWPTTHLCIGYIWSGRGFKNSFALVWRGGTDSKAY